MGNRLIEFYGTECVHCKEMDPVRERVEKEHGKHGITLWDQGWHAAYTMHCKSCGREPVSIETTSPTKPSTAIE